MKASKKRVVGIIISSALILSIINLNMYSISADEEDGIVEDVGNEESGAEKEPEEVTEEEIIEEETNIDEDTSGLFKPYHNSQSIPVETESSEYTCESLFTDLDFAKFIANECLGKEISDPITPEELDAIEYLSIYNYDDNYNIKNLSGISYLKNLKSLDIQIKTLESISEIDGLSELTYLNLKNTKNIKSLDGLGNLPSLENIMLSNTGITRIGTLNASISLRDFSADDGVLVSLDGLETQNELTNLTITNNQITNIDALSTIETLEQVDITNNNITSLKPIKNNTSIRWLYASKNNITSLDGLHNLISLEELDVQSNKIQLIDALSNCLNLKYLYLKDNLIKDVSVISNLTNINSLSLKNNRIESVNGLQNLNSYTLDLSNNKIQDLSAFSSGNSHIQYITLSNNNLTNLNGIEGLTELTGIRADNNKITNIDNLSGCLNLYSIHLKSNKIKDIHFTNELVNVRTIDLSDNKIINLDFLKSMPRVCNDGEIVLDKNDIASLHVFKEIYEAGNFKKLIKLMLSDNNITSLEPLSFLSNSEVGISDLDVSHNKLTSLDGIQNAELYYLHASFNSLTDIRALNDNHQTLSEIDLSNTGINNSIFDQIDWDLGFDGVAILIFSNNNLRNTEEYHNMLIGKFPWTHINFSGNQYNDFSFIVGKTFTTLDLSNTGFKGENIRLLEKVNYISDLKLSNNGLTNEDMNILTSLSNNTMSYLRNVNVSSNKITSLSFLNGFIRDGVNYGSIQYTLDNNDFSDLDVSVLNNLSQDNVNHMFLRMNNCKIDDLSSFTNKKYDFLLQLELNENYIKNISPLYANYGYVYDEELDPFEMNYLYVSILNQKTSMDVELSNTDSEFLVNNPIIGLNSNIMLPSAISHHGTYNDPLVKWLVENLDDPTAKEGIVSFDIAIVLPVNYVEIIPANYSDYEEDGRMLFRYSSTVTVNYTINDLPIDTYQVMYHGNGHTNGTVPEDNNTYSIGDEAVVLAYGALRKEGHSFKEWNTNPNGTGKKYQPDEVITIAGSVDLYAIWEKDDTTIPKEKDKDKDSKKPVKKESETPKTADTTNVWAVFTLLISLLGLVTLKKLKN